LERVLLATRGTASVRFRGLKRKVTSGLLTVLYVCLRVESEKAEEGEVQFVCFTGFQLKFSFKIYIKLAVGI
jgi:hypothetical protein